MDGERHEKEGNVADDMKNEKKNMGKLVVVAVGVSLLGFIFAYFF